eukprot:7387936-Prymnesium_polylepis.1
MGGCRAGGGWSRWVITSRSSRGLKPPDWAGRGSSASLQPSGQAQREARVRVRPHIHQTHQTPDAARGAHMPPRSEAAPTTRTMERSPLCDETLLPKPPPAIEIGVASQDAAGKGEDTHSTFSEGDLAGFGVFDGHSGKRAAEACSAENNGLLARLLTSDGGFPSEAAVADAFWAMDSVIGEQGVSDGTTATVLLTERLQDSAGLPYYRACLAWVGDSRAIRVDVTRPYPLTAVEAMTRNHIPRLKDESKSLERMAAVRARTDAGFKLETALADAAAGPIAGATDPDAQLALMGRVLQRGRRCEELHPNGAESRRNALVIRRSEPEKKRRATAAAGKKPPWVVATEHEFSHPHYRDLQMTRSIGDWKASDTVLPEPELKSFSVGPQGHERLVLATDGLWDVVSASQAAAVCRRSTTPQAVADKLLQLAAGEYKQRGLPGFRDDTTIVVLDLNPSGRPMKEAALTCDDFGLGCGGCCHIFSCCSLGDVLHQLGMDGAGKRLLHEADGMDATDAASDTGTELRAL